MHEFEWVTVPFGEGHTNGANILTITGRIITVGLDAKIAEEITTEHNRNIRALMKYGPDRFAMFMAAAMQGLLASCYTNQSYSHSRLAVESFEFAKAAIQVAELEK